VNFNSIKHFFSGRTQNRRIFQWIIDLDTVFNLVIISYFFIKLGWGISIYGYAIYLLSLLFLLGVIYFILVFDWLIYYKKKLFTWQITFSFLTLLVYGTIFFIFIYFLPGLISVGFFLFLALIISRILRIYVIFTTYFNCRKAVYKTRIKLNYIKTKTGLIFITIFLVLSIMPSIIFGLGMSAYNVIGIDIDNCSENGENQGCQPLQLNFYANIYSHEYLTNKTILGVLNGSNFGNGQLKPVEILLLIRENEINDPVKSQELVNIIQNCTTNGLKIWIWFVYNKSNGYYPSWEDATHLKVFKENFDKWVEENSLDIYGIIFDNEADELINNLPIGFDLLKNGVEHMTTTRNNWSEVVSIYESIASNWSQQGYKMALVGVDFTLLDLIDGDPDFQQLGGIINNPPDFWERVSFMMYRGCSLTGDPLDRDYLFLMSGLHKRFYEDRAVAALGCMGYNAYLTVDDILKDLAIIKAQNYSTVELFEFKAFYDNFGYDGLISIMNASLTGWSYPKFRVNYDTFEFLYKVGLIFIDTLLDLY